MPLPVEKINFIALMPCLYYPLVATMRLLTFPMQPIFAK